MGFPTDWENQEKYKGGWIRKINGKTAARVMGNMMPCCWVKSSLTRMLPGIDDYYEPFDFDYQNICIPRRKASKSQPIARPRSLIDRGTDGRKSNKGPNWEDDCWAVSLTNVRERQATSTTSRRRCIASLKTPS